MTNLKLVHFKELPNSTYTNVINKIHQHLKHVTSFPFTLAFNLFSDKEKKSYNKRLKKLEKELIKFNIFILKVQNKKTKNDWRDYYE